MSYIKKCDICGERISLRQMSDGHWVAFEVRTDIPHEHITSNKKKIKPVYKKRKVLDPYENISDSKKIVDRSGTVYLLDDLPAVWLDLTPVNLVKLSQWSIKNQKKLKIVYSDRHEEMTTRRIYPLQIVDHDVRPNESSSKKLSAWCTLRKDYRTFSISGIEEIFSDIAIPVSFKNKFNALKASEKKRILSGDMGFTVSQMNKNQVSPKKHSKKETKAKSPSYKKINQSNDSGWGSSVSDSDNEDPMGCFYLVVGVAIVIWLLYF